VRGGSPRALAGGDVTLLTFRRRISHTRNLDRVGWQGNARQRHRGNKRPLDECRLTHKSAKKGRYASEEENGEDMCHHILLIL
jgi:hypothetical protein